MKMMINKKRLLLLAIFILGLALRFWWFPGNIYFGFDQARDAFISQSIYLEQHLKILGPSAGTEGLYHGPLWWYLIGPLYLLGQGNPAAPMFFISLVNALGVFLIYYFCLKLFNFKTGFIAAFLYALSFSQTQYAMYFGNPSPAVIFIMIFYLGFATLLFLKDNRGWILTGIGLGLSIQSEFFLIYLIVPCLLYFLLFRKDLLSRIRTKHFLYGLAVFLLTVSTFLIAEFKFNFRTLKTLLAVFTSPGSVEGSGLPVKFSHFLGRLGTELNDSIFSFLPNYPALMGLIFLAIILIYLIFGKAKEPRKIFFLLIWLLSGFALDLMNPPSLYYVSIGMSVGFIIIFSYFLFLVYEKNKYSLSLCLLIIAVSNLVLINKQNPNGPLKTLYVQDGMLLEGEKTIIDLIYLDANKKPFVVNALTMPYKIKTTWAYLFNWYGMKKYGYLPFWGGDDVPGYPGLLPKSEDSQKKYPRYAILEPRRGIPEYLNQEFRDSENGYGYPLWEKNIGQFILQKR